MRVTPAVITAAGASHRMLPMHRIIDRTGTPQTVLQIIVADALAATIDAICVVAAPGNAETMPAVLGPRARCGAAHVRSLWTMRHG